MDQTKIAQYRKWKTSVCAAVFLLLFNLLSHFIPFERASIGNDDYALMLKAQRLSVAEIVSLVPRQPNRPIAFLWLMLQEKFLNGSSQKGLWLIFIATSLVLLGVFFLFFALLKDYSLALLGSLIFALLPNTLEVYHSTTTVYNELAHVLYLASLIAMLYFIDKERKWAFAIALGSYSLAIGLYETGFFLPFVLIAYAAWHKPKKLKACFYFAIPAAAYGVFRLTKAFGLADTEAIHSHSPQLALMPLNSLNVAADLFHQYGGRYIARSVLYGIYNFFSMESPWTAILLFSNAVVVCAAFFWLRGYRPPSLDRRYLRFGIVTFIIFLVPVLINQSGGVGGRHLVLPSAGLVLVVLFYLQSVGWSFGRYALLLIFAAGLIVSQGNAWAQVVACRINAAVYDTLKEKEGELERAERIIIDTRSFADNIPFTWVQRDFNVLNTYYGAQAFEDWGLVAMVALATDRKAKAPYIATESPRVIGQGLLEFGVSEYQGYRSVSNRVETVAREGTVIIDFKSVFGEQFSNGTRTTKMVFHQSLSK